VATLASMGATLCRAALHVGYECDKFETGR
jgi:hypothetical protein